MHEGKTNSLSPVCLRGESARWGHAYVHVSRRVLQACVHGDIGWLWCTWLFGPSSIEKGRYLQVRTRYGPGWARKGDVMELGLMIDLRVAKLGIRIYCYICTCRRVWTLRPPPKTVACPCINTGCTADYKPITLIKQTHLFSQVPLPFCFKSRSNLDSRWVLQQAGLHRLDLQFAAVFIYQEF